MAQQARKRASPHTREGAHPYGAAKWKDFARTFNEVVVAKLEGYQSEDCSEVLGRLLSGEPIRTSIRMRSLLFSNWLLNSAVGAVNADQDSYPDVDDQHLFSAFDETLIFLYVYMAQAAWHSLTPFMYERFMDPALDALFNTLEAAWDKIQGGADTDQIIADFDAKLRERERVYEQYPPHIKGNYHQKGTLSREAGHMIAKALFDSDQSKVAKDFLWGFRFSSSLTLEQVNVQKFIS